MAANPPGSLELAMAQFADGRSCERPAEVRSTVSRLMGWTNHPETCKSCSATRALYIVSGEALCARCREQRSQRAATMSDVDRLARTMNEPAAGVGLVGHAIVFDSWSVNLGGFIERIRPQAVNRLITQQPGVMALWNHESGEPLARSDSPRPTLRYWKDTIGVAVSIIPPSWASNRIETIQRGDVRGMSFGFRAIEDEWSMDGPLPQRDMLDMDVSEFSAVTFPAYRATDVSVGAPSNRLQWLEKLHRNRIAR